MKFANKSPKDLKTWWSYRCFCVQFSSHRKPGGAIDVSVWSYRCFCVEL